MSRTVICGFEVRDLGISSLIGTQLRVDGSINAGTAATIDTSIFRSGTGSLKLVAASGVLTSVDFPNGAGTSYARFYLRVTARPATTARIIAGAGTSVVNIRLNPDGTIAYYDKTTLIGTSSIALTDTTRWYCIEYTNIGGAGVPVLRIDGNSEVLAAGAITGAMGSSIGPQDAVADTYTVYYDDLVGDGAEWPGPGVVALLKPTSVNARGGWVRGAGATTTNLEVPISTVPPPGLASANETDNTNVESPTNSATDNLDMNMTTYTAAGVTGVVKGVLGFVRHGEDIATSTKSGALQLLSNPADVSETAFTYGQDNGAHGADGSGAAVNWFVTTIFPTANPVIALSTAPVLRVGKRTATTRVVCVDFMGIYVDYVPAPVTIRTPNAFGRSVDQALNRAGSF